MFLVKNGKLACTDEVLLEMEEVLSPKEYCELILYLLTIPQKKIRRELKKWALNHDDSFVRSVGEWM